MDIETATKREKILEILLNEAKQHQELAKKATNIHEWGHHNSTYDILVRLLPKVISQILAFDLIDVQWSPIKDSLFICPVNVSRLKLKYSGNDMSPFDIQKYYSGSGYRNNLEIAPDFEKTVFEEEVLLTTHKLATRYEHKDYDTALDKVAAEIADEINSHLLLTLDDTMQDTVGTEYFHKLSTYTPTSTWCGDGQVRLPILINRACNLISARTRVAAGNWCMVPPVGVEILEKEQSFTRTETTTYGLSVGKVGKLNGAIDVYVNTNWTNEHEVLIGYGGDDNGFIYVPYKPIIPSVGVIDPMTFEPFVAFRTQFGIAKKTVKEDYTIGIAQDYLGKIKLSDL